MTNKLQGLHAAQLEHVTGGFDPSAIAGMIQPITEAVSGGLQSQGNQQGAAEAQKWGGIVSKVASSIIPMISGGAQAA